MIISSPIDNFFRSPSSVYPSSTVRTSMFVLRRDLEKLYGSEKRRYIIKHKAPLLACLGIMSGWDLLTKLWIGKISSRNNDFKKFLKDICKLNSDDGEALYQFRCALAHNYGLYATDHKYEFRLDDSPKNMVLIQKVGTKEYHISFWALKKLFLLSLREYESILRTATHPDYSTILNNFMNTVKEIGYFEIK